jgi:pyruvate/2-oxoglutarate dehydrogenase complex dihydrolipoamide acyltransferase (E2) component
MKSERTDDIRKLSMYGFDSVNNGHNIFALLEFDITDLRKALRDKRIVNEGGSLFAFLCKAIAKCLYENPLFNSMIDYKKTTNFESVDISIPIEIERNGKTINKQYLIKNASEKSIKEITFEINESKNSIDDQIGYILAKSMRLIMKIVPGKIAVLLIRHIMRNHKKVKELSGTVFITSVSMFSNIPGYIIPYIGGPKASSFAIGSTTKKPVVRNNEIVVREIINITAVFNHDIIDGAPAARFINQMRKYIESDYMKLIE